MKKSIILLLVIFSSSLVFSQENVKWYTIQEAEKLTRQDPRPLLLIHIPTGVAGVKKWTGKPYKFSYIRYSK